jgi:hypothetical protein
MAHHMKLTRTANMTFNDLSQWLIDEAFVDVSGCRRLYGHH